MTLDQDTDVTDASATAKFEDEDQEAPDVTAGDSDEADELDAEQSEPAIKRNGLLSVLKRRLVPILLGVALIASAALASVAYFTLYRPDRQTDAEAADAVVQAASDGTVALLSYSPDTLDQDFANAKSHLTGDFLSYYSDFTSTVVKPAAQQKKVKTSAKVVQGAVSELQPQSASVLLFINQTTTSQEIPDGSYSVSSVKVGLSKIDGNWLISSFDPV